MVPVVAAECGGIGRRSRRKPELLFGNAICFLPIARVLREYRALQPNSVFQMQSFVMSFAKAAFGWPVYATWNLVAYTKECRRSAGARKVITPVTAILFLIFTTWVWEALWVAVFWLLLRLAQSLSFV
jgi:hypothetical protein